MRYIISFFILIFFSLCSVTHAGKDRLTAMPESECGDCYSLINKVKILQSEPGRLTVKLYETGGGDPAVNGNRIIMHINQWDPEGKGYTWDTGIDIYEVKEVELKNNRIILTCTQHVIPENTGDIKTIRCKYSITFLFDKTGSIEPVIEIEKEIQGTAG